MVRSLRLVALGFLALASAVFAGQGDKPGEVQRPLPPVPNGPAAATVAVRPLTKVEQARFEKGKTLFAALCAACHQPGGQGQEGLAPTLINSRWILGDPRILSRIVLNGKARDNLIMPPWKVALDDDAVAAVLTFVRRSWGHEADPVEPAVAAEARAATADREEPYQDEELEKLARSMRPRKP